MTSDQGRTLYRRWRRWEWIPSGLTTILRLLPAAVARFIYDWTMGWPGMGGVVLRYAIAGRLAHSRGEVVLIGPEVEIRGWRHLEIGSRVSINRGCYVDASGGLRIGDDVSIAHASSILTTDHTWDNESIPIRENPVRPGAVQIERDVWLGCGVRVLAGVTIGSRVVVAAGAVVVKNVPPRTVVGGVPARSLKGL